MSAEQLHAVCQEPKISLAVGGVRNVEVDTNSANVLYRNYAPHPEAVPAREFSHIFTRDTKHCGVFIYPGFPGTAFQENFDKFAQTYADMLGVSVTLLTATADDQSPENEVHAMATYIENFRPEIEEALFIGHSLGTRRATALANHFRERREQQGMGLDTRAVVLVNPSGMYEQSPLQLSINTLTQGPSRSRVIQHGINKYSRESTERTALEARLAEIKPREQSDLVGGIKERMHAKGNWLSRAWHEIQEVARMNPALENLKEPTIVVLGVHDRLFQPEAMGLTHKWWGLKKINQRERDEQLRRIIPKSAYATSMLEEEFGSHVDLYMLGYEHVVTNTLRKVDQYYYSQQKERHLLLKKAYKMFMRSRAL